MPTDPGHLSASRAVMQAGGAARAASGDRGRPARAERAVLAEGCRQNPPRGSLLGRVRWKYVFTTRARTTEEMYDLAADAGRADEPLRDRSRGRCGTRSASRRTSGLRNNRRGRAAQLWTDNIPRPGHDAEDARSSARARVRRLANRFIEITDGC